MSPAPERRPQTRPAPSLRRLLLALLLGPLLGLWLLGLALGQARSLALVHEAHDRALAGAALVIRERMSLDQGQLEVDLPYAALEMLRTDAQDRVFYRVSELPGGQTITGYADLPAPPAALGAPGGPGRPGTPGTGLTDGPPQFEDQVYKGQPVRLVALTQTLFDGTQQRRFVVQVAETLDARRAMTHHIATESALWQLALIACSAGLLVLGVQRGLRPLRRLRQQVGQRAADELAPMATDGVPREVVPLIQAINQHTERQRELMDHQRQLMDHQRQLMDRQRQLVDEQQRFIASASHQLKTPLTVLRAQADLALQQADLPQMRATVLALRDATDTTAHMVHQLLALAQAEPGRPLQAEALDLGTLAQEVCLALLGPARARQIDLGFEGEQVVTVQAERLLLREMLHNLVDNALRYIPAGGCVTVRVLPGTAGEAAVGDSGVTATGPQLQVDDNGPGLSPDDCERVLAPFYRLPGMQAEGSGLGLSIVRQICQRHGLALRLGPVPDGPGLRVSVVWPAPLCTDTVKEASTSGRPSPP